MAPTLKTGDLFIACANPSGRAAGQYVISSSPWDHVGIIWKHDDGEVYVIDSGSARYYKALCRRPLHFGEGAAPAGSASTLASAECQARISPSSSPLSSSSMPAPPAAIEPVRSRTRGAALLASLVALRPPYIAPTLRQQTAARLLS